GYLVRQRLDERGMNGQHRIEKMGQVNPIRLGGQSEEGTVGIESPGLFSGDDLQVRLAAAKQQLDARLAVGALINELNRGGASPLDIDHRNGLPRDDALDFQAGSEILKLCHALNHLVRFRSHTCRTYPLTALLMALPGIAPGTKI